MKNSIKSLFLLLLFCSCSVSTQIYESNKPVLNMVNYFCGTTEGYGVFFDYRDRATVRFKIIATGNCDSPGILKLNHNVMFEDDRTESYNIEYGMTDNNHLVLSGSSIVEAEPVEQYGNVVHSEYTKKIQLGLNAVEFAIKEDMYMIDENQVMNKVNIKKTIFTFGDIIIMWRKVVV
jgi:hypothetical protein